MINVRSHMSVPVHCAYHESRARAHRPVGGEGGGVQMVHMMWNRGEGGRGGRGGRLLAEVHEVEKEGAGYRKRARNADAHTGCQSHEMR